MTLGHSAVTGGQKRKVVMGSIHRLIETHGRDGALALVSDEERPLIDIAAAGPL